MDRLFPIFVKLARRRVLVVGGGAVAENKIRGLLDTGARIHVVALRANDAVQGWAESGVVVLEQRAFQPSDLDGVSLVVAATSSRRLNELIFGEARLRGILCNVVDVPQLCDFYYPAVVRRGDLQIAISTSGRSPSLARRLREQLEEQFGPDYARWVEQLGRKRQEVLRSGMPPRRKRELLRAQVEAGQFRAAAVRSGRKSRGKQS